MALVDEYKFGATAGTGGDGVVRWRREKFRPKGGPCGGNGGKGGDVYLRAIRDIMVLGRISHIDTYKAQNGIPGGDNSRTGADAPDLYIDLPTGSIVTNTDTGDQYELLTEGETVCVLEGGAGGMGNEHFKSSTNQRPMQATKGKEGVSGHFNVELRLIADIGLIGLPNAGKTSILNALTSAGAKVGDYPFTTLDPNLGVYHRYVIADVPGLIEGASEGKGLGHKFLRHIARTRVLVHCISLERDNLADTYNIVRNEISQRQDIEPKQEYVLLTKTDTVDQHKVAEAVNIVKELVGSRVLTPVSILDDAAIKSLGDELVELVRG